MLDVLNNCKSLLVRLSSVTLLTISHSDTLSKATRRNIYMRDMMSKYWMSKKTKQSYSRICFNASLAVALSFCACLSASVCLSLSLCLSSLTLSSPLSLSLPSLSPSHTSYPSHITSPSDSRRNVRSDNNNNIDPHKCRQYQAADVTVGFVED